DSSGAQYNLPYNVVINATLTNPDGSLTGMTHAFSFDGTLNGTLGLNSAQFTNTLKDSTTGNFLSTPITQDWVAPDGQDVKVTLDPTLHIGPAQGSLPASLGGSITVTGQFSGGDTSGGNTTGGGDTGGPANAPEPSTMLLSCLGLSCLGASAWRKRR